ncbi:MAG: RNA-binding S4 domain-containing protein [Bacteroidetes bacterium]|nr:RNA-binding S4 domain-containing protein [Bacteroidota bacterium]
MEDVLRIDKWLWSVRLFKTRSQAADACRGGKVSISGQPVKPSRDIKIGIIIQIKTALITKTVKVIGINENRVSAKIAVTLVEDLTPAEEYKKLENTKDVFVIKREKGSGRPTKKDRREIDNTIC